MKKHLLFLILIAFGTTLSAQENKNTELSFTPVIGLGISTLTFKEQELLREANFNYPLPKVIKGDKEFSVALGAYLNYSLSPKTSLSIGFLFSKENLSTTRTGIFFGSDYDPILGMIVSSSSVDSDIQLWKLSLPLLWNRYLKEGSYFLTAGIGGNIILSNEQQLTIRQGNGEVYNSSSSEFAVGQKNILGILGIGRKIHFAKPKPALLIAIKGNYFFFTDDIRFYGKGLNSAIFMLEIGYEF